VAHHLQLLGARSYHEGAGSLKLPTQFCALFKIHLFFRFLDIALASHSEMLSHLNILLLSFQFIYLFLEAFNKVLGDRILGHATLADSHPGVRGTQVQLLENLILGDKRGATRLVSGGVVVTLTVTIKVIEERLLFLL
jgi:hypothetical protein